MRQVPSIELAFRGESDKIIVLSEKEQQQFTSGNLLFTVRRFNAQRRELRHEWARDHPDT